MIYRKLKRTWSNGYTHVPSFQKVFPELKRLSGEELCDRLCELNMDFYYEEKTPVKLWVRFTMPFALITILLMLLFLPVNFIITGHWGYSLGNRNYIYNWIKSLDLMF